MPATKVAKLTSTPMDPYVTILLGKILEGKHVMSVRKGKKIFSQGDRAEAIYFVETGRVKVSVVSSAGKEAVLAMLGPRQFFGEGALVGQSLRVSSATAVEPSTVVQVERRAMLRGLHDQADLSEKFMVFLLARNIDLEADLCDQLFNHTERRLARVLLNLSRFSRPDKLPDTKVPKFTHKMLAEIVGTTRPRITFFLNKFRKLGLIDYGETGDITVKDGLLTDLVLRD